MEPVRRPRLGKRTYQQVAASILFSVLVCSVSTAAYACSCTPYPTPGRFVKHADVIFSGIPLKTQLIGHPKSLPAVQWTGTSIHSSIRVLNIYKGDLPSEVTIESVVGQSRCGWQPKNLGTLQLFVARKVSGRYSTNLCMMSALRSHKDFVQAMDFHGPD